MTAFSSVAPSRRRPWGDVRFVLGIVLIVVSVAGVWFVVTAARHTTPVYVAARTIVSGQAITDADLRLVDVALGATADGYLAADALVADAVAVRTIAAGELVPVEALGDAAGARSTGIVVQSTADVPASVGAGSTVEVWSAPRAEDGSFEVPRILVADATVVSVQRDEAMVGGRGPSLEIVVPRSDIPLILGAMTDEAAISVVPTGGGLG